jgi:hypothetical protein
LPAGDGEELDVDLFIRWFSVMVEWSIFAGLVFFMLLAVQTIIIDLGMPKKYMKGINLILTVGGIIAAVFLVAHLTTFYPGFFL